jgi:PAS domain S-box-containing protein
MQEDVTMTSPFALEPEIGLDRRLAAIVEYCDDAIISLSLKGIVTSWNRGASKLFGYTAAEMIGQSIVRIIPLARHAEEEEILARISRGEMVRHFETRRMRSDDTELDISLTVSPIKNEHGAIIGASKVARDITSQKRTEEARRKLIECSRLVGRSFFDAMVGALAEALQVRWVLLCDLDPAQPARARTLAAWSDGRRQDNFEYDLAGTPCANVVGEQMCFYPTGVASLFPKDVLLTEMGAESYLGLPLRGADGRTLGLLAILNDKPLDEDLQPQETLELFAGRAAAELERLAASSANERLGRIVEDAASEAFVLGRIWAIAWMNCESSRRSISSPS